MSIARFPDSVVILAQRRRPGSWPTRWPERFVYHPYAAFELTIMNGDPPN